MPSMKSRSNRSLWLQKKYTPVKLIRSKDSIDIDDVLALRNWTFPIGRGKKQPSHLEVIERMKEWLEQDYNDTYYTEKNNPRPKDNPQRNYNSPLWEFQNTFLEHLQPHPTNNYYWAIMRLGDVFRGLCGNWIPFDHRYVAVDSIGGALDYFKRISNDDFQIIRNEMEKPEIRKQMSEYLEKLGILQNYFKSFNHSKEMEGRKVIQRKSLELIRELTDWGLKLNTVEEISKDDIIEALEDFKYNYVTERDNALKRQWRYEYNLKYGEIE